MPIYVRDEMEDWHFEDAQAAMEDLGEFIELRDAYELEVAHYGFVFPDFQDQYEVVEGTEDIDVMEAFMTERQEAMAMYEEARVAVAASRDLATTIGLNVLPDPALTLTDAYEAFNDSDPELVIELSNQVHLELAYAAAVGQEKIDDIVTGAYGLLALLFVMLIWLAIRWRRTRRRVRFARLEQADPEPAGDQMSFLPILDGDVLDAMYLDDRSPTGHLSAWIAEAQAPLDPDGQLGLDLEEEDDPTPEAV